MDTTKKFDGKAKAYTASRPGYASELIECLYSKYDLSESSVIADIGSGTGKFAKLLLDKGSEVYCVEPNNDMRDVAEKELCQYKGFHSVAGDAENTTLNSNCVDCITVAQAFHWFDANEFKKECLRIIKSNGYVFLIWNFRDVSDDVYRELHDINLKYCPDFKFFNAGIEKNDKRIRAFFVDKYEYVVFDNPLLFDRERFIARCLSSSYSLKENDSEYESYNEALNEVFDKYNNKGVISTANKSVAYIGKIK
ncbi:MAG: class I SAM-dependent methyltransferase [Acutalibacteraceae bacterium]